MNEEQILQSLLAQKAFSSGTSVRCIEGTGRAGQTIGVYFNITYTRNGSQWDLGTTGATLITATINSNDGKFQLVIPDDLVIRNICFESSLYGNNADNIYTINMTNIGDVSQLTNLTYCFGSLSYLTQVGGFGKFSNCSNLKSIEGCFRSCPRLQSVDLTGLQTDGWIAGENPEDRNGYAVLLYNSTTISTLKLPKLPYTAYSGSKTSAFSACNNLANVTATGVIENNLYLQDSPLTLASMKSVLSHLSTTHSATCSFSKASWTLAKNNSECLGYINTATTNGWTFDVVKYENTFTTANNLSNDTGSWWQFDVEDDSSSSKYGQAWMVMHQLESDTTKSCVLLDLEENIEAVDTFKVVFDATMFSNGTIRGGIETSNNYVVWYLTLIDADGNESTTLNTEQYDPNDRASTTLDFSSAFSSSFDKTKIRYLKMDILGSSWSKKDRKKGVWLWKISMY